MKPLKAPTGRTLHDIQEILINATVDQLEAPLEMRDGKYQVTSAMLQTYGLAVDSNGLIKRIAEAQGKLPGPIPKHYHDYNLGSGITASFAAPAGFISEIMAIQASLLCGPGIADRTFQLLFPDMGFEGAAGTFPISLVTIGAITPIAANEYAYLVMTGKGDMTWAIDTGVLSTKTHYGLFPLWLGPGAAVDAKISAGNQGDEDVGLDLLYRAWPYEVL